MLRHRKSLKPIPHGSEFEGRSVKWKYTLSEPLLDERDKKAVADCLDSGWLSMGPKTQAFEQRFAEIVDAKHAIAVANGTAALHLALAALGVGESTEDEVIQPSINFVAAANMTKAIGAKPVFADIISLLEPTISPEDLEQRITSRTKAVVVMHYGGYPARISQILEICKAHGVPVIEDACHAPGYRLPAHDGRSLGTYGDIGCFSFFSSKNMTTGEGGMITTMDDGLAARIRTLRSHGMTTLTWDRHHGRPSTYDVEAHGFNYRIDDIRSALGLTQLERLADMNSRRQSLAEHYADEVRRLNTDQIHYVFGDQPANGTGHLAAIIVGPGIRDAVRNGLAERGIQSGLHYPPVHQFSVFNTTHEQVLPTSETFARSMITLPMYAGLADEAIPDIIKSVFEIVERHDA